MGYHPRKQQLYITFDGKTIGWNEGFNVFTGKYGFVPTNYFRYKDRLFANNGNGSVYSMATGSDYMKWFGDYNSDTFNVESVFNKYPEYDKRPFATALATPADSIALLAIISACSGVIPRSIAP